MDSVTNSGLSRGCSAVGSASPCQGEGREFESRHPLHVECPSTMEGHFSFFLFAGVYG